MIFGAQPEKRKRSTPAMLVSLFLHLAVLGALMHRPGPALLTPTSSLHGDGGGGMTKTMLVAPGASVLTSPNPEEPKEEIDHRVVLRRRVKQVVKAPVQVAAVPNQSLRPGMPGYILGSMSSGFVSDHDVRVALPVVAPDPPIVRSKLPDWIRGDVIVEVTISEQGEVTQTVVLSTVGFGLEDIIVSTLRQWHFVPAKVDGVAVASRQDVHFHFPS